MLSDDEIKAMENVEINDLMRCLENELEYRETLTEEQLHEHISKHIDKTLC